MQPPVQSDWISGTKGPYARRLHKPKLGQEEFILQDRGISLAEDEDIISNRGLDAVNASQMRVRISIRLINLRLLVEITPCPTHPWHYGEIKVYCLLLLTLALFIQAYLIVYILLYYH